MTKRNDKETVETHFFNGDVIIERAVSEQLKTNSEYTNKNDNLLSVQANRGNKVLYTLKYGENVKGIEMIGSFLMLDHCRKEGYISYTPLDAKHIIHLKTYQKPLVDDPLWEENFSIIEDKECKKKYSKYVMPNADILVKINVNLFQRIDTLNVGRRIKNCMQKEGFVYLGDLIEIPKEDHLKTPGFAEISLNDFMVYLESLSLELGMKLDFEWPKGDENILELKKHVMDSQK